jgi:hypothetical protein
MCTLAHACQVLFRSLNEVLAENLQFPNGLNLTKIAFLTLLGLNSNQPPLHYRTGSLCPGTADNLPSREKRGATRGKPAEESSLNSMKFSNNLISGNQSGLLAADNFTVGLCLPQMLISFSVS